MALSSTSHPFVLPLQTWGKNTTKTLSAPQVTRIQNTAKAFLLTYTGTLPTQDACNKLKSKNVSSRSPIIGLLSSPATDGAHKHAEKPPSCHSLTLGTSLMQSPRKYKIFEPRLYSNILPSHVSLGRDQPAKK